MASSDPYAPAPRSLLTSGLSSSTIHVILYVGTYADFKTGRNAFPATDTIAEETGLSRRTVYYALKAAIAAGWLNATKRARKGKKIPTSYDCRWWSEVQPVAQARAVDCTGSRNPLHEVVQPVADNRTSVTDRPKPNVNDLSFAAASAEKMRDGVKATQDEQRAAVNLLVRWYNARCPDLRPYEMPTDLTPPTLAKALRWRSIKDWVPYFDRANESLSLATIRDGQPCDLVWLVKQETVERLEAGAFDD